MAAREHLKPAFATVARCIRRICPVCVALLLPGASVSTANPWNGRVVLQGFWWDYYNNNYPADWATYLAHLAPCLRELGIDAVWIPPTSKTKNSTRSRFGGRRSIERYG